MYLRELRLAQMERIMAEFIYGVDIYLSVVRDAKEINPKVKHTTEQSWSITTLAPSSGHRRAHVQDHIFRAVRQSWTAISALLGLISFA